MNNAGSCKIFSAHSVLCFKKKKIMPFLGIEKRGVTLLVSEPGFRSSREKCVVRVVSRVRTRVGLVLSDHCFGVLML